MYNAPRQATSPANTRATVFREWATNGALPSRRLRERSRRSRKSLWHCNTQKRDRRPSAAGVTSGRSRTATVQGHEPRAFRGSRGACGRFPPGPRGGSAHSNPCRPVHQRSSPSVRTDARSKPPFTQPQYRWRLSSRTRRSGMRWPWSKERPPPQPPRESDTAECAALALGARHAPLLTPTALAAPGRGAPQRG